MTDSQSPDVLSGTDNAPTPAGSIPQDSSASRRPGIVVLHDWYGLDEVTRGAVAHLGRSGHIIHAPDLFAGLTLPEDPTDAALADWTLAQYDTAIVAQVMAAVDELTGRDDVNPAQIGVVGLGWGGAYALIAAAHDGRIRAAASVGGTISYPVLTPRRPGSPLNFIASLEGAFLAAFAGSDSLNPAIEIERVRARLVEHDKTGEVKVYDGAPPRFWRDARLPQTAALWRRLDHFLNAHLRPHTLAEREHADVIAHEEGYANAQAVEAGYPNEASRLHA